MLRSLQRYLLWASPVLALVVVVLVWSGWLGQSPERRAEEEARRYLVQTAYYPDDVRCQRFGPNSLDFFHDDQGHTYSVVRVIWQGRNHDGRLGIIDTLVVLVDGQARDSFPNTSGDNWDRSAVPRAATDAWGFDTRTPLPQIEQPRSLEPPPAVK